MNKSDHPSGFEVFFDGACPLCRREIEWLRRKDSTNQICFTDIADPDFDPHSTGKSFQQLMARIHGRLPNGEVIEGVEVIRQLYLAVGYRKLVAISRLPLIRNLLELGYRIFAPIRLRLPGRHCHDGSCSINVK